MSVLCSVEGCWDLPHAGGMCGAHYMRLKRTGDATTPPRRPGRPKDPGLEAVRKMMPEASERTQARFNRGMRMMRRAGVASEVESEVIARATRPNGSFNVSSFEAHAESVAVARLMQGLSEEERLQLEKEVEEAPVD